MTGILTFKENILFDGSSESWLVFCIELTSILIQNDLLELFLPESGVAGGTFTSVTPPHQFFQSVWLGKVLNMEVNNTLLRWTIKEGNMYGIRLLSWLKFIYESY